MCPWLDHIQDNILYFFALKIKIRAIFAGMATIDLLVPDLLSQRVAIDGFHLINQAVLAASIRADVIIHSILVEFPTEGR